MTELHDLTAAQQLRALRAREVSSRELTDHYLRRIDRWAQELGAFVTVTEDFARDSADRADELLARGEGGALTGLPLSIKDLHATAGIPTTVGSRAFAGTVPTDDAWTVGLLRAAGAVIVGKSSTSEFGATCYTEDALSGRPAVTPYDPTRYSSGSSGGAATAVAAGLVPIAHGSDGAGSIRTPAATTHLIGVKPSRGLVSTAPASSFLATGTEGPLARTVEDAALMLDVMTRPSPGDLYGWRPSGTLADAVSRGPDRQLRIAFWIETGMDRVDTHPDLADAVRRTADRLRAAGHEVREVDIPARLDAAVVGALRTWLTSAVALSATALVPPERRSLLAPLTQHLIEQSRALSGADVVLAQTILARYASTFLTAFDGFDLALTPTTSALPVPLEHFVADGVEGVLDRMLDWSCPTPWVNLTGQPAVAVPAGLNGDGLPLSIQLIGRSRADGELLALAAELEAAMPHSATRPMCWTS